MNRLRRYLGLPAAERHLFRRALLTVVCVRLSLWLLPFRTVRRLIERPEQPQPGANGKPPAETIAWAVAAAGRYVPRATCLVLALAARRLCARAGHSTVLHVGVSRAAGFAAHAWLDCDGRVLVGGEEAREYAKLLTPGERRT